MTGEALAYQFTMTGRALGLNLEGVTHEESLVRPTAGGNSINWVVGHIVASRPPILDLISATPVRLDEAYRNYARGSTGNVPPANVLPLPRMLDDLAATTEALRARLLAMPEGDFRAPSRNATLGERLAFLAFHENYHVGQVGLLRRLTGKPGAIR